jgi:hypothetical protein
VVAAPAPAVPILFTVAADGGAVPLTNTYELRYPTSQTAVAPLFRRPRTLPGYVVVSADGSVLGAMLEDVNFVNSRVQLVSPAGARLNVETYTGNVEAPALSALYFTTPDCSGDGLGGINVSEAQVFGGFWWAPYPEGGSANTAVQSTLNSVGMCYPAPQTFAGARWRRMDVAPIQVALPLTITPL